MARAVAWVVFGLGADPSLFARFLVGGPFRLLDELERHREGDVSYMIETGHEVDAFDAGENTEYAPAIRDCSCCLCS